MLKELVSVPVRNEFYAEFSLINHMKVPVKIIQLKPRATLKKCFFWSNLYKIEVMITSLIKILELPNIGYTTTFTI